MRFVVFSAGCVLLTSAQSQAQAPNQSFNPLRVLNSEYLQQDLKLTTEQRQRIRQINLQMEGVVALQRPDVVRELAISDGQLKHIQAVYDDYARKRREALKQLLKDPKRARKRGARYTALTREQRDAKVLNVLTRTQRRKFEAMKGKPFDGRKLFPRPKPRKKRPDV